MLHSRAGWGRSGAKLVNERLVAGLAEAWQGIVALLESLDDDGWNAPTGCSEWNVFELAAHLAASEAQFQGLADPSELRWIEKGLHAWAASGVDAWRNRSRGELVETITRASTLLVERLKGLDDEGWTEQTIGPLGPTTMHGFAQLRLFDTYVHLLDLRYGLGQALDGDAEPDAAAGLVDWVMAFTPQAAVNMAGIVDDCRIRIDLAGAGGRTLDLVVAGRRGAFEPVGDSHPPNRISGPAIAFALLVTGRTTPAAAAGGVDAEGAPARQLVDSFRIF